MGSYQQHQTLVKRALLEFSKIPKCRVWANNTGVGRDMSGERIIRFGLKGSPDIIGIYNGYFIGIEVKTGKAVQNKDQKNFERMAKEMGAIYIVFRESSLGKAKEIIDGILVSKSS